MEKAVALLHRWSWVPALLVRLYLGYFFLETGWGKVHNLDAMTERFAEWGIPWPHASAVVSGFTELMGGGLLMVGLLTRLAALPLAFNMLVATLSVKMKQVSGLSDFVELDEPLYALCFLWLAFVGPGPLSVDHWIWRRISRKR